MYKIIKLYKAFSETKIKTQTPSCILLNENGCDICCDIATSDRKDCSSSRDSSSSSFDSSSDNSNSGTGSGSGMCTGSEAGIGSGTVFFRFF